MKNNDDNNVAKIIFGVMAFFVVLAMLLTVVFWYGLGDYLVRIIFY